MTKNPVINALSASAYIFLVVTVMNSLMKYAPKEDGFLAPVLALSMFTLSAAVMGYIFGSQPLQLFLDGKKKEAVKLGVQTIIAFAVTTAIVLALVITGSFLV